MQTAPPGRGGQHITVSAGSVVETPAFGVAPAAPGKISGSLWTDWNHNGLRDADDTPRFNAPVYLDLNEDGARETPEPLTGTEANGRYAFINLPPGNYIVRPVLGGTLQQTYPTPPAGMVSDVPEGGSVTLDTILVYNSAETPPAGRVGGQVWSDRNADGVRQPDEPAASGLTVWLDGDNDGVMQADERRATTDNTGTYVFRNASPGTYRIRPRLPLGWQQTFPAAGAATVVTLAIGVQQVTAPDIGAHSYEIVGPILPAMGFEIEPVATVLPLESIAQQLFGDSPF